MMYGAGIEIKYSVGLSFLFCLSMDIDNLKQNQ